MKRKLMAVLLTAAMVAEMGSTAVLADQSSTDALGESTEADELLIDPTGTTFEVDGITYTVTSETTCEISNVAEYSEELTIPSTVETSYGETYTVTGTADGAFSGAAGVRTLNLPSTLTYFGNGSRFSDLKSITVEDGSESFFIHDGVLFEQTDDGISLVLYPSGAEDVNYVVPTGVTEIRNHAFYGAQNLHITVISSSVDVIGEEAFSDFVNPVEIAFNTDKALSGLSKNAFSLLTAEGNKIYFKSAKVLEGAPSDFYGESDAEIITAGIPAGIEIVIESLEDDLTGHDEDINTASGDAVTDLKAGWYVIKNGLSAAGSSYALDMEAGAGSATADANADIYTYDSANILDSQLFYLEVIDASSGLYTFKPYANQNFALDCDTAKTTPGTNVRQHKSNKTVAQQFYVRETGLEGEYQIIVSNGQTCLSVAGNQASDGANVELGTWNNDAGQRWSFIAANPDSREKGGITEGYYYLTSGLTDSSLEEYVLDVGENTAATANSTNIDIYQRKTSDDAQIFYIKQVDAAEGIYTISPASTTSLALDCNSGRYTNGTNIIQYTYHGNDNQKFKFIKNSDNSYEIKSVKANTCLTVEQTKGSPATTASNGANVALGTWKNLPAQKWMLKDASTEVRKTTTIKDGWYQIKSGMLDASGAAYALDVNKNTATTAENANLDVYKYTADSSPELFYVAKVNGTDNLYTFTPLVGQPYVMDVDTAKYSEGTNVRQHHANNTNAQRFFIYQNSDGSYSIRSYLANAYLTLEGNNGIASSVSNGTNVALYKWADSDAQKWSFELSKSRTLEDTNLPMQVYEIHTAIGSSGSSDTSTRALTMMNASMVNSTNVAINKSTGSDTQKFILYPLGNSQYYILGANSLKSLDVTGGSPVAGTNVQIYDKNGTAAQIWTIKVDGYGYYRIYSSLLEGGSTKLALDVENNRSADGQNVLVWRDTNARNQKWIISSSSLSSVSDGTYYITSGMTSGRTQTIDVPYRQSTEDLQYQMCNYKAIASQMYELKNVSGGVTLKNKYTGKYISVSGTKAVQKTAAYTWKLAAADNKGGFYLKASNGYCLSISGGTDANFSLLILRSTPDKTSVWNLTKTMIPNGWYQESGNWYYYSSGSPLKSSYIGTAFVDANGKLWNGWHKAYVSGAGFVTAGYYYYWDGKNGAAKDARPWMMSTSIWSKNTKRVTINNHNNYTTTTQTGINTSYVLHVNTKKCYIIIYAQFPGKSGEYAPVCAFKTSPGTAGNETDTGNTYIKAQYNWTELMGPSYGQYTSLVNYKDGEYIHSVACGYQNDYNVDAGAYNLLGQRASHGCMRVNVRNAFWVYCYVPVGTGVIIRDNDELPLTIPLLAQPKMTGRTAVDPTDPAYTGNYGYADTNTYYGSYYFS